MKHTASPQLTGDIQQLAMPLRNARDLDPLLEKIGDARFVLLGEASHGTHEYYTWRAAISKRLIEEKGFSFIAVEGDWPDCYTLNRYVKGYDALAPDAQSVLNKFSRWPTWMWANWEIAALLEWMKKFNAQKEADGKAGFFGLDVYSLWESMEAIMEYLRGKNDPEAMAVARKAYSCFEPFNKDSISYARAVPFIDDSCQDEVLEMLLEMRRKTPQYSGDGEGAFSAEQNALVAVNAERYYRAMLRGGNATWNIRDEHMMDTLNRLMKFHGESAKAIVWEHNTHIGDARATDMAGAGMVNVGQLAREEHSSEGVVLVGFGCYKGTVIAGDEWGAQMEKMEVPEAREGSWEKLMHEAGTDNKLLLLDEKRHEEDWCRSRGHRAIGVVYDPRMERYGNYVPTVLPDRYDAFLYIDETKALHALHGEHRIEHGPPDTYPFGV